MISCQITRILDRTLSIHEFFIFFWVSYMHNCFMSLSHKYLYPHSYIYVSIMLHLCSFSKTLLPYYLMFQHRCKPQTLEFDLRIHFIFNMIVITSLIQTYSWYQLYKEENYISSAVIIIDTLIIRSFFNGIQFRDNC